MMSHVVVGIYTQPFYLRSITMSADANEGDKVRDLRRLFEDSATQEKQLIQEIDRSISEISDYINQVQRFCCKKSSEIKDLRKNISDSDTGNVITGYSLAKNMIQQLEGKVAEKSKEIMRLKKDVAQRDLKLSTAEKNVEENNVRIQELHIDISEKRRLIEEMNRQITELKHGFEDETRTSENQLKQVNNRQSKCSDDEKDELISSLRKTNDERNAEIEQMHKTITRLRQNLAEKENQHRINKQLSNRMKIRQLEPLAKKSKEIEELLNKLKQETVNIAERLAYESTCQPISTNTSESSLPERMIRG
jgi:predicted  nucleic acid-binding Zn-ribbon protein